MVNYIYSFAFFDNTNVEIYMKITVLDKLSLGEDTPLERFSQFGEAEYFDSTDQSKIEERVKDVDVIITNKVKITSDVMDKAKNLKLICVFATGYDNIDTIAAKDRGIGVCNVPGYSTDSVTLFTVSTALALYSHLYDYREYVNDGRYSASSAPNRLIPVYHELRGKTWGIVGFGNIGSSVAKIAQAFGAETLVCTRTPKDGYNCVDIDTLCKNSDIISLHCPLTDDTRCLINEKRISLMKPNAILVNEARGAVVDEAAVADAILLNKIGGYGCDVYSKEPFSKDHPYNRIKASNNVILTPHAAWGAYEARVRCVDTIVNNINSFLHGEMLNRIV